MKLAIVGISGAVGREFLSILEERNFSADNLFLFGSAKSVGKKIKFNGKSISVKELKHNEDFKDIDIALLSAGSDISKEFEKTITKYGTIMIDNSSAFRMCDDVPLVVPEVNAKDALAHPRNIIANPNCTTIQMVVVLKVLEDISHIKRVYLSSYQSASGAGAKAMEELKLQTREYDRQKELTVNEFLHQLLFNVIPHIDTFTENGYTKEEMKMYNETKKIMHSDILVSSTCVRVPVMRAHSESIWAETEKPVSVDEFKAACEKFKGITLVDNPQKELYPMPLDVSGKDDVYVGRIRKDIANENGIAFWCVADQLRKGAALNAIQIADYIIANKF